MTYALFLDDERDPPRGRDWVVVRSVDSALRMIAERGVPSLLSLDHDLGPDAPTGLDFVKALVELDLDGNVDVPSNLSFSVHSQNPVGAANIASYLGGYLEFKTEERSR